MAVLAAMTPNESPWAFSSRAYSILSSAGDRCLFPPKDRTEIWFRTPLPERRRHPADEGMAKIAFLLLALFGVPVAIAENPTNL